MCISDISAVNVCGQLTAGRGATAPLQSMCVAGSQQATAQAAESAECLQVRLQCGATEELSGVQEPNRCEYTAVFATPAACTPALAAAVTQRLQSWNLHDEL